jgi:hypothetical protein
MRENDIIPRICITIRKGGFENLVLLFLKYSMIFLKSFSPNLPVEIMKWNSQFFFIFFFMFKVDEDYVLYSVYKVYQQKIYTIRHKLEVVV